MPMSVCASNQVRADDASAQVQGRRCHLLSIELRTEIVAAAACGCLAGLQNRPLGDQLSSYKDGGLLERVLAQGRHFESRNMRSPQRVHPGRFQESEFVASATTKQSVKYLVGRERGRFALSVSSQAPFCFVQPQLF